MKTKVIFCYYFLLSLSLQIFEIFISQFVVNSQIHDIAQYPMLPYFFTITIMRYFNKTANTGQVGRKSATGRLVTPQLW